MGMRVRLVYKLAVRYLLMQDAVGTIVDIEFHPDEFNDYRDDWRYNQEHTVWKRGYVYLRRMPLAVHVTFDECNIDVGLGVGVISVKPSNADWEFKIYDVIDGKRKPRKVKVV